MNLAQRVYNIKDIKEQKEHKIIEDAVVLD